MRNALVARNNGVSPLPQVIVLVLLQAAIGDGGATYRRPERRAPLSVRGVTPEDDEAKIAPTSSATSSVAANQRTPHISALGFLSRGHVLRTPDELRRLLPQILNATEASRKPDGGQWPGPGRQGDTAVYLLTTSSHFGIPHLARLGFGAVNSYPLAARTRSVARGRFVPTASGLRHVVMLGVGSFLGAMIVILVIFVFVILRRTRKQRRLVAHRCPNSKDGESKLSLLRHEMLPAIDDVGNELSTTSCSSASSGCGDTSSHTSDTSDTWRNPDHIILSSLVGGGEQPEEGSRRRSERSGTNTCDSPDETPTSLLLIQENPDSQPAVFCTAVDSSPSTSRQMSRNPDEQSSYCRSVPDLLLPNRELDATRHGEVVYECTRSVSRDGGIMSCAGGDVMLVIPPGSVPGECRVQIQANPSSNGIRGTAAGELILSPIVDIRVSGTEFFRRPVTLSVPCRSLCTCVSGVLALRCWDQATWIPTGRTLHNGVVSHYTWPDCFSPEPAVLDQDGCPWTGRATYSCSANVCTIRTNVPGTFCLTSSSRNHSDTCRDLSARHHDDNIRLCVAIGAKCHLDYRISDDVSSRSYVRQINYTICLSDNTASGRQEIEEFIRTSGGQLQCACVPLDVAMGSEVKVTLSSVSDPEWPWEIPFDSTSKVIGWQEFCNDYNTLVRVEFRCLSRSDDLLTFRSNDVDIVSIFQVETEQHTADGLDTVRINLVADNGHC